MNLYQDTREGEDEAKKKDDMAEWDEGQTSPSRALKVLPLTILTDPCAASREIKNSGHVQARQPQNHH